MTDRRNQIRINLSDAEMASLRCFAQASGKRPAIAARAIILEVLEDDARAEAVPAATDRRVYA